MGNKDKFYDAKPAEPVDEVLQPNEAVPEHLQGVGLDDVFKYGVIIARIIQAIKSIGFLGIGQSESPGMVKFQVSGREYEWNLGTITRTK